MFIASIPPDARGYHRLSPNKSDSPVQVCFYATLRAIVDRKTVEIAIPDGADVQRLVEIVVGQFPDLGEFLFGVDGSVS